MTMTLSVPEQLWEIAGVGVQICAGPPAGVLSVEMEMKDLSSLIPKINLFLQWRRCK